MSALTRTRLSRASLPAELAPPFDPAGLRVGIVHLGIGAFHRAHQAVFTQDAIAAAGGDWGICGVTQRSSAVRDQLVPQDCLYGTLVRGPGEPRLQLIGAVREVLSAPEAPEAVVARLAAPSTRVVTITVSEKGYRFDAATRQVRWSDPEVAGDLTGRPPRTVIGQLVAGLAARRQAGGPPVTVVCCDNLPDSGRLVGSLVRQFAERAAPPAVGDWIDEHVRFPRTMVDRIVPATTTADRREAAALSGVWDEGLVVAEPFSQWVIEDDFAAERPNWERAGALLVPDVPPYERAKVRLLNGAHSTLAYLGQLAGYELVSDVLAADSPIVGVVRRLMREDALPTLDPVPDLDLEIYQQELLDRFANPGLAHRTAQIAIDGSQKLPQRLIGTIADRRRAGAEPRAALLGLAAWIRVIADRTADDGRRLAVDDPLAELIAQRLAGARDAGQVIEAILGLRPVVGDELPHDPVVRAILVEQLERLRRDGAEVTAQAFA